MKRPCGATFGFGGKLVSFSHHKQQVTDASGQVHVRDHPVISLSQVSLAVHASLHASQSSTASSTRA